MHTVMLGWEFLTIFCRMLQQCSTSVCFPSESISLLRVKKCCLSEDELLFPVSRNYCCWPQTSLLIKRNWPEWNTNAVCESTLYLFWHFLKHGSYWKKGQYKNLFLKWRKGFCVLSSGMERKFFFSHLIGLKFRFRVTGMMLDYLYKISFTRTSRSRRTFFSSWVTV